MSGAVLVPERDDVAGDPADSDQRLVARVRRGDDRAFELLYARYQRRIHAYVLGMVKDHGRAEDVTQEVFVSALRRMRATEQPLAFRPWLYQIAKNGCIDAFRRSKRTEEVSYDADEALAPADHSKLVGAGPSPDAAVAAKQDIESLCGAFGGLSETHHEILVLRELEGLSYEQIGQRMGMTRPAVESTLFRARRRLTEEFDDIVSGARCLRIQGIIVTAMESALGTRDTRRLARHLAHCQACRREALSAGLDRSLFARPPMRERVATRVAGFLPLPAFLRFRRGADDALPSTPGRTAALAAHLPAVSDHLTTGWGKTVAGAAVLVAGLGAGVGVHHATSPASPAAAPIRSQPAAAKPGASAPPGARPALPTGASAAGTGTASSRASERAAARGRSAARRNTAITGSPTAAGGVTPGGGGTAQPAAAASPADASSSEHTAATKKPAIKHQAGLPNAALPAAGTDPIRQAAGTVEKAADTVPTTPGAVQEAVQQTTEAAAGAVGQVTRGGPVADAVGETTGAANAAVGAATQRVDQAATGAANAVGGITGG
jgi:RNA polymerase sigma factor (sigma-70 family)